MNKSSKKKSEQLGMNVSTAHGKLKKSLLFNMSGRLFMLTCFRCGETIENEDDLSIDHKEDWLDSDDPSGKFFNVENISFSHKACNYGAARKHHQVSFTEEKKRLRQNEHQRNCRNRHPERYKQQRREKYKRRGT